MGSMARSIKRKRQLAERKAAKKKLRRLHSALDSMPDHCRSCGKSIETIGENSRMDWHVEIDSDSNVALTCPKCKGSN